MPRTVRTQLARRVWAAACGCDHAHTLEGQPCSSAPIPRHGWWLTRACSECRCVTQLAKREQERRGLEMQLSEVVSHVREHEKAFVGEQSAWGRGGRRDSASTSPPSSKNPSPRVKGALGGGSVALPAVHAASVLPQPLPMPPRVGGQRAVDASHWPSSQMSTSARTSPRDPVGSPHLRMAKVALD